VTWLFANRNFAWDHRDEILSGPAPDLAAVPDSVTADLEALRIHDRFGISSWPQMIACDPRDMRLFGSPERTVESVEALLDRACEEMAAASSPRLPPPVLAAEELEKLLLRVERSSAPAEVLSTAQKRVLNRLLSDEGSDIVLRLRALQIVIRTDPAHVRQLAPALLQVPNDPFRYAVMGVLAADPDPRTEPDLLRIFRLAGQEVASRNPNVLRINAVRALGPGGGSAAVAAFSDVLADPDPRNYLHRLLVETCGQIGARTPRDARGPILEVLLGAVPGPVAAGADEQTARIEERLALAMVRSVRTALAAMGGEEGLPAVPAQWGEAEYRAWLEALRAAIGSRSQRKPHHRRLLRQTPAAVR